MTSRINYNTPLKSVRTIRALKIDQCELPKKSVDEPGKVSDADLINKAGIAFVWENAPGRSKINLVDVATVPAELKPPPHQARVFPEADKSPPPAGSSPTDEPCMKYGNQSVNDGHPPPPAGTPNMKSQFPFNNQLPPKPSQRKAPSATMQQHPSGDKPPSIPRRTAAGSVLEPGHHSKKSLLRNGAHSDHSGSRTRSEKIPAVDDERERSFLASTGHTLTSDQGGVASHKDVSRGSQDSLITERLPHASGKVGRDFYLSGRYKFVGSLPSAIDSTQDTVFIPTRPDNFPASETSSHSDDGDQTDAGDAFSTMNTITRDPDGRCQVSVIDGEPHDTSRHTDPRARDFIMERFLPAAKAMVTETDASDRRQSKESPTGSPARGKGRSFLPGRSRFAFKDQFGGDEVEPEEEEQTDMLFKCKFPWQMGAMTSGAVHLSGSQDTRSVEQSPSPSLSRRDEDSPGPHYDAQEESEAAIYAGSSANATPKGSISSGSFEARRFPPKARDKTVSINSKSLPSRIGESQYFEHVRAVSFHGESSNGDSYGSGYTSRRNDKSAEGFLGVPKDRLNNGAPREGGDLRSHHINDKPSAPPPVTSLAMLLKTSQQQRRDLGKTSEAAIQAAVANVREPVPPSSILNHHRCKPALGVPENTPAHSRSTSAATASNYHSREGSRVPDENNCFPQHLRNQLSRQKLDEPSGGSEGSGRSLESLNDEAWVASSRNSSAGSKSPARPENCDRPAMVFPTIGDSANIDTSASGWPLGKAYTAYTRTPSADSKDASFSSFSDHSIRSPSNLRSPSSYGLPIQQENSLSENYSPVSVLPPPLPKSPAESWLFKVRQPANGNWPGTVNPKKHLDYSMSDDSMDVKWEVLVKSENAKLRHKLAQEPIQTGRVGLIGGDRSVEANHVQTVSS